MQKTIARVLNKFRILYAFNTYITNSVNGTTVKQLIDYESDVELLHVLFIPDLWMIDVFTKLFSLKEGCFMDVGTNIGHTLAKVKSIDRDKEYIGFEPNPVCVAYMQKFIKLNRYKNVTLFPVAIFSEDAVLPMYNYEHDAVGAASTLIDNLRPNDKIYQTFYVPAYKFETIQKQLRLNDVSILKIDVEGAELEVLESLYHLIEQKRPFIVIEILPIYSADNIKRIDRIKKIEKITKDLKYSMVRIIKNKNNIQQYMPINSIEIHSNIEWSDYILCPDETLSSVTG